MIFYDLNHHANLGIQKDFYEIIITYMNLAKGKAFPASLPKAIVLISRKIVSGQELYPDKRRQEEGRSFPGWCDAKIVNRDI